MKKEKILIGIIAGLVIVIAGLLIALGAVKRSNSNKTDKTADEAFYSDDNEKTEESSEKQESEESIKDCGANAEFVISNTWESENRKYAQIDMAVNNTSDTEIKEWNIQFPTGKNVKLEQSWNCDITEEVKEDNVWFKLSPVDYNRAVPVNEKTQGIGFIISADNISQITAYTLTTNTEYGVVSSQYEDGKIISGSSDSDDTEVADNEDTQKDSDNETNNEVAEGGNSGSSSQDSSSGSSDSYNPSNSSGSSDYNYSANATGRLHVSGSHLVDASGSYVQLKGVSTHGLAWYPQYVNKDAFRTLRDDWGANVVRLAMYTAEYGGYCSGGDKEELKSLVDRGVNYAAELGMYVIIDWHILSDSNPYQNKDAAIDFFAQMAQKYSGYSNVIYEICNEPQNSNWNSVIRPYATEVISTIRQYDSNAVIIVGTNTWSQDVDEVIGNKLEDDNVMYALHFYAGTHKDWIRNKLINAMDSGVPVFVSECSICDASGNGGIDYDSANEWLNLLNSRGVSFIAWSLSNKNETSALINLSCNKLSDWSDDELSDTGRWFKQAIRN